jgi:hypothetical protein
MFTFHLLDPICIYFPKMWQNNWWLNNFKSDVKYHRIFIICDVVYAFKINN